MLRNVLISVGAFGLPIAVLVVWAMIAMRRTSDDTAPQALFLYVFGLPIVVVTSWLVAKGPPRSALGTFALLLVSPGIGLLSLSVLLR